MTTTRLNDLFDKLEPEKGNKLDDKIQVEDSDLENLITLLYELDIIVLGSSDYIKIIKYLDNNITRDFSNKTITKLTQYLTDNIIEKTINENIGLFLNYLIQESDDEDHTIYTNHHTQLIMEIGYQNSKNITVHGNLGELTGIQMKSGTITVNGNVKDGLGDMMLSGEIKINGKIASISRQTLGGDIYQHDKQIVKDGELLDKKYLR